MKTKTVGEAQRDLAALITQAREEAIGLTDEEGNLLAMLAGVNEDDLDDRLVQTPGFREMIARSRASLKAAATTSAEELLAEARADLAKGRKEAS